jgi:hypothetical protein
VKYIKTEKCREILTNQRAGSICYGKKSKWANRAFSTPSSALFFLILLLRLVNNSYLVVGNASSYIGTVASSLVAVDYTLNASFITYTASCLDILNKIK